MKKREPRVDRLALPLHKMGTFHILWRCLSYLRPYWRITTAAYLALLGLNALNLLIPQFIRWIVDWGIGSRNTRLLGISVLALLGLTLMKGLLTFAQGQCTEIASQNVAYDLRNAIHRKLCALSFSYHDRSKTGQILSRAIQDVDRIRFVTGRAFLRLVDATVLLLGTLAVLTRMNFHLALLALSTFPLLAYQAFQVSRYTRPLSLEIQQQLAVLTTRLEQNLRGIRIVKAFAQEEHESARFDGENARWHALSARLARLQAFQVPLIELIANTSLVFMIWYGGILVFRGQLSLGALVAFITYVSQLVQPVRRLGMIIPALSLASAASERVFEILDTASEVQEVPDAVPLPPMHGHVRFEHVSFAYFGRYQVLTDISFEALPGQMIALVGSPGSGKSTIINLIPRFYDPSEGRITIDGYDIRHVALKSLRDQIGIVLQETMLFASTIRENIAFGRPDASKEEIIAAARAAQAHSFICELPNGYDTIISERGVTLSAGQRQRLAIARALLKKPRLFILDDATSNVDAETERLIQTALQRFMHGHTCFVIAQRLSTVSKADLILVLDKGRIAARGTHPELLRTSGLYAEIYHQLQP